MAGNPAREIGVNAVGLRRHGCDEEHIKGIKEYLTDVCEMWDEIELLPTEFHELSDTRLIVFGRVRARRELAVIDAPNAWLWEVGEGRIRSARVFGDPQGARELLA